MSDRLEVYLRCFNAVVKTLIEEGQSTWELRQGDTLRRSLLELVDLRFGPGGWDTDKHIEQTQAEDEVTRELDVVINGPDWTQRLEKYTADQTLFARCPELLLRIKNGEMLSAEGVEQLRDSDLVKVPGGWGRLDPDLPPALFKWAKETFRTLFVRLDPRCSPTTEPGVPLKKATVRPVRPDWWKNLSLKNHEKDGGHYVLERRLDDSRAGLQENYEYAQGLRTLELFTKRCNRGNLSMMFEELMEVKTPPGTLIGRCVHFDTDALPGTDCSAAKLNHLDLAINVYFGESVQRRRNRKLSDGIEKDASTRTHLLRIEGAPFPSSVEFLHQFFKSSTLLNDWMKGQLNGYTDP